jgi:hypothetical protein
MRRVKIDPSDLFKFRLNPMKENMTRGTAERKKWDESEEWSAFEVTYEKSIEQIGKNVNQAIGRDSNPLYGSRRLNLKFQVAADDSSETMVELQKVRRDLKKLKDIIHSISEACEVEIEVKAEAENCRSGNEIGSRISLVLSEAL